MIGTSDGEQYEDSFAHTLATMPPGPPEKPADALKTDLGTQVAPDVDLSQPKKVNDAQDKQWQDEGWENHWEHAVPYGGAGGNNQTKEEAIKKFPGMEWIDQEGKPKGGTLYFRGKKAEPLTS